MVIGAYRPIVRQKYKESRYCVSIVAGAFFFFLSLVYRAGRGLYFLNALLAPYLEGTQRKTRMSDRYQGPRKGASREEGGLIREPGGIILKESPSVKQQVEAAYMKAEEEQWNTKEERSEGHRRWTSEQAIYATPEEEEYDEGKQKRRMNYCAKVKPGEPSAGAFRGSKIAPTCPPHPVGGKGRKESCGDKDETKWDAVIQQWGKK